MTADFGIASSRYEHSGRVGTAPLIVPIAGAVAALVLGLAYGYVNVYNPLIYVQFAVTAGYGWLIGYIAGRAAVAGKCRNGAVAAAIGLLAAALAVYAAWAGFLTAMVGRIEGIEDPPGYLSLLLNPAGMWAIAGGIAEEGWFTLKSLQVKGGVLWVLWFIEVALVLGMGAFFARSKVAEGVFCESCDGWCDKVETAGFQSSSEAIGKLRTGELSALEALAPVPDVRREQPCVKLVQTTCSRCGIMGTYRLIGVTPGKDDKGNPKWSEEELTGHILVTPQVSPKLSSLMAKRGSPAQPPSPQQPPPPAQTA